MELHRGRLFDHVHIHVKDLEASKRFYRAVFGVFGIPLGGESADHFRADELWVDARPGPVTANLHFAIQAPDRDQVHAFHEAGLKAGGRDNGAPGERKYHPGYYAAFLLDPDGNNIEAVYHGPGRRSAPSVVIQS